MLCRKLFLTPLAILSLSACQGTLPQAPQGNLCIFNAALAESICKPISPQMVKMDSSGNLHLDLSFWDQANPKDSIVPASQMINWITTDPITWGNIEAYINELKLQCSK